MTQTGSFEGISKGLLFVERSSPKMSFGENFQLKGDPSLRSG
jgi:hypothetical protein